jgi:hypothetical protein
MHNNKLKDSLFSSGYDEISESELYSNRKFSNEFEKLNSLQEIKINESENIADKIIKPYLILEEREKKEL